MKERKKEIEIEIEIEIETEIEIEIETEAETERQKEAEMNDLPCINKQILISAFSFKSHFKQIHLIQFFPVQIEIPGRIFLYLKMDANEI